MAVIVLIALLAVLGLVGILAFVSAWMNDRKDDRTVRLVVVTQALIDIENHVEAAQSHHDCELGRVIRIYLNRYKEDLNRLDERNWHGKR